MAHKWAKDELIVLETNYQLGATKLHDLLPDIAIPAIRYKLKSLGLNSEKEYNWSEEHLNFLVDNANNKTIKELAEKLSRTPAAIRMKLQRLNIKAKEDTKGPKIGSKYNRSTIIASDYILSILKQLPNTGRDWYNINKKKEWPSASTISNRFGSWSNALIAAGLPINIGVQKLDKLTKVYLIEFDSFYKVGITQQELKHRFSGYPAYKVLEIKETTLEIAKSIEKQVLELVRDYKYIPDCLPKEGRGYTECFIAPAPILAQCKVYFQE